MVEKNIRYSKFHEHCFIIFRDISISTWNCCIEVICPVKLKVKFFHYFFFFFNRIIFSRIYFSNQFNAYMMFKKNLEKIIIFNLLFLILFYPKTIEISLHALKTEFIRIWSEIARKFLEERMIIERKREK